MASPRGSARPTREHPIALMGQLTGNQVPIDEGMQALTWIPPPTTSLYQTRPRKRSATFFVLAGSGTSRRSNGC